MVRSNKTAVDQNGIDEDERLDMWVPRNGSKSVLVTLTSEDEDGVETPIDLSGQAIVASAKTSYEATSIALAGLITERDDPNGIFRLTYSAASAKSLGIDVIDLVHDVLRAPSGGGQPVRIFAGLLSLSKGVASPP